MSWGFLTGLLPNWAGPIGKHSILKSGSDATVGALDEELLSKALEDMRTAIDESPSPWPSPAVATLLTGSGRPLG